MGGAELAADRLARGMMERGHDVVVLTRHIAGTLPDLPYMVSRYHRPPAQHLWPELLAVPLWRTVRRYSCDVVLAFYAYPCGYAAGLLKRRMPFRLIVAPRGSDLYPNYHELKKPRVLSVIRRGYRGADRIVSISGWLTGRLHEVVGPPLPPIDQVCNGIDLDGFDRRIHDSRAAPPPLTVRKPFLLHLGRLHPVKRHDVAIEAVARLKALFEQEHLSYVIAGDGEAFDSLRHRVTDHNLNDIVHFIGSRAGLDKAWLFDNARFFVTASREEGMPNVVLEAMAAGLPVLASDIDPHRELIEGKGWGRLFREGDADDMAKTMQWMITADLAMMREKAMVLRNEYTLDRMIDGYERACLE